MVEAAESKPVARPPRQAGENVKLASGRGVAAAGRAGAGAGGVREHPARKTRAESHRAIGSKARGCLSIATGEFDTMSEYRSTAAT